MLVNIRHNNRPLAFQLTEDFRILRDIYSPEIVSKLFKDIATMPNWKMYLDNICHDSQLKNVIIGLYNKYRHLSGNELYLSNWCQQFVLTDSERNKLKGVK